MYGIKQMTMEQLFTRLLYEDWDDKKYSIHEVSKNDSRNSIKGSKEWFEALEKFCWDYEESVFQEMRSTWKNRQSACGKGADRHLSA